MNDRIRQLKSLRRLMCLSQEEAARHLHISRSAYGAYERGERTVPPDILCAFADLAGVSVDYVMDHDTLSSLRPETDEETELLLLFRHLDPPGRREMLELIRYEKEVLMKL